ncbi:MAG: NAD(P)-binding domain-containing protein [Acidimicrobiales bacterium]
MVNIYYEADADRSKIADRKVAVLGYGSQGHAHALNLKESGIDVRVGLREGSSSVDKAKEAGLEVRSIADAVAEADLIMMLMPDTEMAAIYEESVAPNLNDGDALFFAHGFNIRFGLIAPPQNVDVCMVAPKGRATWSAAPTPRAAVCRASSPSRTARRVRRPRSSRWPTPTPSAGAGPV